MPVSNWIVEHRAVIILMIGACGVVCQYLNYRHFREGRANRGDLGYFWRKWREGDRDGKIMIYLSFIAIALGLVLSVSILISGI